MNRGVVVIGAGQAAAQLAISLRQAGYPDDITIIGEEPYPPYQRPPLSKKFLLERGRPASLFLRSDAFWGDHDVAFELASVAGAIDLDNRSVSLVDGRVIPYTTLVFATGTRAKRPPLPGVMLPGVVTLRTIADVQHLRDALDDARRIVVIGAGYIGLETAAVMRAEGRNVIVLEAEERVLKRVTAPTVSEFFDALHRERGVNIRLGARVAAFAGDRRVTAVHLADGTLVDADLVLLATGAQANDGLARETGLTCADGIVVDEFAHTTAPDVYAIGDCTRFPSRRYGRHVRLESVQNAIDQAKAAAAAIAGDAVPYDPVPWFWSDQYELKLQIAGLLDGYDTVTPAGDRAGGRYSVEYRRSGRLIAVDAVNEPRAHMLARRRIAEDTGSERIESQGAA
jgi:3-phenylpropionate/trans-cinnamate dioxygenase ferredoxin reductase component